MRDAEFYPPAVHLLLGCGALAGSLAAFCSITAWFDRSQTVASSILLCFGAEFLVQDILRLRVAPAVTSLVAACVQVALACADQAVPRLVILLMVLWLLPSVVAVTEEQRFWSRRRTNSSTLAFASAGARAAAALLEAAPLWVLLSRPALPGGLPLTTATYIGMILCVVGVLYAIAAAAQRTSSQTVVKTQRWTARGVWRYSQHPDTLARATVIFGMSVLTLSRVPATVQDVAPFLAVFSPLAPVFLTRAGLIFDSQLERLQSMPSYAVYRHQTPLLFPGAPWTPSDSMFGEQPSGLGKYSSSRADSMQDALTNAKKAWNPGKRKNQTHQKKKKKNIKNKNKGGSKRSKTPKRGKRSSGKAKSRQKSD